MTRETYVKVTEILRKNPGRVRLVKLINRTLTGFVYVAYPVFLLRLFWQEDPFLLRAIFVPAVSFVGVSLFRRLYNAPRPYEKFQIAPVIDKETRGRSFPSRHVFSVFVIAMTVFYQYPGVGALLLVIGVCLGVIRVIGGVHEPRDVIAGALIGICCGAVGFYVI